MREAGKEEGGVTLSTAKLLTSASAPTLGDRADHNITSPPSPAPLSIFVEKTFAGLSSGCSGPDGTTRR